MAATPGRYARAIKYVKEAEDLARSGALVLDDGLAAIYFLWGQPSHAYVRREDQIVEGDAALKEIALDLANPGKVEWNNKDVIQVETLRCNAEDLITILQSMATAAKHAPAAKEAQSNGDAGLSNVANLPKYDVSTFPLLPTGPPLWADVPTNVVHLDVLLGALPTVLVRFNAPGLEAAGLVVRGELFDAVAMSDVQVIKGKQAWTELLSREDGKATAYEISEELAEALPILWRSQVIRSDLESRWFDPQAFLESQLGAKEDRAVIINSTNGIGVAVFLHGNVAGSYTTNALVAIASVDPLIELIGHNSAGTVTILERVADDSGEPFLVAPVFEAPVAEVQEDVHSQDQTPLLAAQAIAAEPEPAHQPEEPEPPTVLVDEKAGPPQPEKQVPPEPLVATPLAPPAEVHVKPQTAETVAAKPAATEGIGSVVAAFNAMASAPAASDAPPAIKPAPPPPPPPLPAPISPPVAATSPPVSRPAVQTVPTNYAAIVTELLDIGTQYLGKDFDALAPVVASCSHTPQGLREAIVAVRDANLPGQPPDQMRLAARAMQLCVADRVTGT
jgi:hypothetical protein